MDEFSQFIQSIELEKALHPNETPEEMHHRIIQESQLMMAQSLMYLAYNARSDKLRWKATKELLDGGWTTDGAERISMYEEEEE